MSRVDTFTTRIAFQLDVIEPTNKSKFEYTLIFVTKKNRFGNFRDRFVYVLGPSLEDVSEKKTSKSTQAKIGTRRLPIQKRKKMVKVNDMNTF